MGEGQPGSLTQEKIKKVEALREARDTSMAEARAAFKGYHHKVADIFAIPAEIQDNKGRAEIIEKQLPPELARDVEKFNEINWQIVLKMKELDELFHFNPAG